MAWEKIQKEYGLVFLSDKNDSFLSIQEIQSTHEKYLIVGSFDAEKYCGYYQKQDTEKPSEGCIEHREAASLEYCVGMSSMSWRPVYPLRLNETRSLIKIFECLSRIEPLDPLPEEFQLLIVDIFGQNKNNDFSNGSDNLALDEPCRVQLEHVAKGRPSRFSRNDLKDILKSPVKDDFTGLSTKKNHEETALNHHQTPKRLLDKEVNIFSDELNSANRETLDNVILFDVLGQKATKVSTLSIFKPSNLRVSTNKNEPHLSTSKNDVPKDSKDPKDHRACCCFVF